MDRPARTTSQGAVVMTLAAAALLLMAPVGFFTFVVSPFSEGARATGGSLLTFWHEEGPAIREGFATAMPQAWSPIFAFRIGPVGAGLLVLLAYLVARIWWRAGALHADRPSRWWLSGCAIPMLVALVLYPYQMFRGAGVLAGAGLGDRTYSVLGSMAGEGLSFTVFGAELGLVLLAVWISARLGWLATILSAPGEKASKRNLPEAY